MISGAHADIQVLRTGLQSPPAVTLVGNTVYALEGKILYLVSPALKGKDPGPFKAYAVPLPTDVAQATGTASRLDPRCSGRTMTAC